MGVEEGIPRDRALRPLIQLMRMRERYGDVFEVRLAEGRQLLVIADPELVKQVFSAPADVLHAGEGNRRGLGWVHREGALALLDGQHHMARRRLLAPAFHGRRLERHGETIRALAATHLDAWPVGEEVAALPRLRALTREVARAVVLGDGDQARRVALDDVLRELQEPAATSDPGEAANRGASGPRPPTERLAELVAAEVEARRDEAEHAGRSDVLSHLLGARDEDGEPLSGVEARDEAMALLVTGSETTAAALAWALERLSRSPAALAPLEREIRGGPGPQLDATISETLRMRPPVVMSARLVKQPFRLGERVIEPDTLIGLSALLVHHRPDVYPEPEEFRPERFLGRQPGTYTWFPFGGGVRRCVGAGFAQMEMRIVLSALLERMTLSPTGPEPEPMRTVGSRLLPARGARVALDRRDSVAPRARDRRPRCRASAGAWEDAGAWEGDGLRREVFFFRSREVELYGSLFAAAEPSRPHGVVVCQSWGVEADRTDPLVRSVALATARLGGAGLVFHYPGFGDSFGDLAGVDLRDLAAAAAAAVEEAGRRRPGLAWTLAGLSFGASVACLAARAVAPARLLLVQPSLRPGSFLRRLAETTEPLAPGPSPREMKQPGTVPGMAYGYPIPRRIADDPERADAAVAAALAAYPGEVTVIRHERPGPDQSLPERFERVEVPGAWRFGMQNHPGLARACAEWLDRRTADERPATVAADGSVP